MQLQEGRKPTQWAIAGRIAETASSIDGVMIEKIKPRWDMARREARDYGGMYQITYPSGVTRVAFGNEILIG